MVGQSVRGVARWSIALVVGLGGCRSPASDETSPPPPVADLDVDETPDPPRPDPAGDDPVAAPTAKAPEAPAEPPPPKGLVPLSDDARTTFMAGATDDFIPVEIHYVQSNETRHDLFFPYIAGTGGAYAGVGADQNYTMIAAARSELAFLMDIDSRVVDLHKIYAVLFREAETPEVMVALWERSKRGEVEEKLRTAFAELPARERSRILSGFRVSRETVYRHLQRVIARTVDGETASWLSNTEMYDHVRTLFNTGRVRVMAGNLAGDHSMITAGKAAEALDVPLRVLYLSNAEEYFKYTPQFRANIEALPTDGDSMVLRTIYSKKWVHADLWAYQVQPTDDLKTRLIDRRNRSRKPMLRYADNGGDLLRETGHKGLSLVALKPREN